MRGERDAPVGAGVDAGFETRESSPEFFECPGAAARKTRFFPYFVKAPWVAGVAALQVDRTDTQPARDPNIDGIILGQRPTRDGGWRLD